MATYKIKCLTEGNKKIFTVEAHDEKAAGKKFAATYPDILPDSILEVRKLDNDPIEFVENLYKGNFGLPMTYWVYGVLAGFVWGVSFIALQPDPEGKLIKIVGMLFLAYYFAVYVGIWNAANKYEGNKIWAILAKFVVIIVVIPTVIHLSRLLAAGQ